MTIAILYICTGKYTVFWEAFYRSAERYLVPEADKHYFVFTDAQTIEGQSENPAINLVHQERLGWPHDTLKRFHLFDRIKEDLMSFDYIFFFNANAQILQPIAAADFLPTPEEKLVAVLHPGYFDKSPATFTYESKQRASKAFIKKGQGQYYFAGGLNGGESAAYLQLIMELRANVQADLDRGVIAVWHDESHLNRYLLHRNPKVLSPAYLYPEGWELPFKPIILIRDKSKHGGHDFLRNVSQKKPVLKKVRGFMARILTGRK